MQIIRQVSRMDRKEAIELIKRHMIIHQIGKYPHIKLGEALSLAIEALQEPEIVHCKDCRLRKTEECAMQYECDCGEQHSWENDNDYCSWGKRCEE